MGENLSVADMMAFANSAKNNGCDGFGEGGMFIWLFFLFYMMAWGGGGLGGNRNAADNPALQGALTRSDLFEGFNNQEVVSKLDGIAHGVCDSTYALTNAINGIGMNMMGGFNGLDKSLSALGYEQQSCCCSTKQAIAENRYVAEKSACDIMNVIREEGAATRALINANMVQDLRDRLEQTNREAMVRDFQLSQQSQTANIIGTVRPFPQPAYITCSPYTSANSCCPYGCAA